MDRIYVSKPDLGELERAALLQAYDSGWISSQGEHVNQFELEWAQQVGSKYALAVSNGTVALHLILASLEIGPGDEVIVPSLTFIASVNAITYVGAKPVFVDVNRNTWCIDVQEVSRVRTEKTKAILGVHLYGNLSGAMDIQEYCKNEKLFYIEDSAEAPFAEYDGKMAGNIGHVASFSFFGNKILTSGEGGAVTTSDPELYKRMKLLRDQGMSSTRRYYFEKIGFNFRLTNLQASILRVQLKRSQEMLAKRRTLFEKYRNAFIEFETFEYMQVDPKVTPSPWLFTFLVEPSGQKTKASLMDYLESLNIESRPIFIPVHSLPAYSNFNDLELPNTSEISNRGISLPTSSVISESEVDRIIDAVTAWNAD